MKLSIALTHLLALLTGHGTTTCTSAFQIQQQRELRLQNDRIFGTASKRFIESSFWSADNSDRIVPLLSLHAKGDDSESADEYDEWYSDFDPSKFEDVGQADDNFDQFDSGRNNKRARGRGGRRGGYDDFGPEGHDYERDTSADNSSVDLNKVNSLISERLQARKTGQFDEADAIRDVLLVDHGVIVRDKERMWRSGCSSSGSGQKWGGRGGGGDRRNNRREGQGGRRKERDFGPNGHDYNLSSDAGPNTSSMTEEEIHKMLATRLQSKLTRDFDTADQLEEELAAGGVSVHDGRKEWRADGQGFGYSASSGGRNGKPGRERGSRNDRNRPYQQSPDSLETSDTDNIQALVDERMKAKRDRNYNLADEIRDQLRAEYNVEVEDRMRQWSVGGYFPRQGGENDSPYTISPTSAIPDDFEEIQALVNARDQARKDRDFDLSDSIRDQLQDRNIFVKDRIRQWSVQGQLKPYQRRGGGDLSSDDELLINKLLEERSALKQEKQFGKADRIRDRLMKEYQIRVDDRAREWHVVSDAYLMAATSIQLDEETKSYIQEQVSRRAVAKLNREYDTADAIRDELRDDYLVLIDDRLKEWTALPAEPDDVSQSSLEDDGDDEDDEDYDYVDDSLTKVHAKDDSSEEIVASEETANHDDLTSLTVVELKDRLRSAGLPVSGKKDELIERLVHAAD